MMAVCGNKSDLAREVDQKALTALLEKHKMKYFETSARSGNNVENMFLGLIDEINALQAARRKKQPEDDLDLNPPSPPTTSSPTASPPAPTTPSPNARRSADRS